VDEDARTDDEDKTRMGDGRTTTKPREAARPNNEDVDCTTGKPCVAFRETITQRADFNYTHKNQTGGVGQFAKVVGYVEPMVHGPETGKDVDFENVIMGASIPSNFIRAVEKVCMNVVLLHC
jgi:translation elongation factor EF-G